MSRITEKFPRAHPAQAPDRAIRSNSSAPFGGFRYFRFYPLRCPETASVLFQGCGFASQTQGIYPRRPPAGPAPPAIAIRGGLRHWILPAAKSISPPTAESRSYSAIHGAALRAQPSVPAVSGL
jgi:hypothetical protein